MPQNNFIVTDTFWQAAISEGAPFMKQLYEGKTKNVLLDEETGIVHLFFKDSATGENGVFDPGSNSVGGSVEGKGRHPHTLSWW